MKTTRTLFICLLLSFTYLYSSAQTRVIRGVITDITTGEKLPGVNVIEMNKNNRTINGTISDNNGEFIIQIQPGSDSIKFSFIGYTSLTVAVGNKPYIEAKLSEEAIELEGVVKVAQKKQTTGFMPVSIQESSASISKVDLRDAEHIGSTSIEEALAGQLSGVDISMSSGDPGASISIQIRGASSINGKNEPLILINGVVFDTDIEDDFEFTTATADDYGGLVDIAPDDIESIEIYKDAAASALYGPKAANGVLAINTKKGKRGPSVLTYSYKHTFQEAPDPIPLLNGSDYVLMQLDAQYNRAMDLTGEPPELGGQEFYPIMYKTIEEYPYAWEHSQNTNWVDAVTQRGVKADHNFSISGGGDKAAYRLSLGHISQEGTSIGTSFERLSTRLNLDYQLTNNLSFNSEFSFTNSEQGSALEFEVDGKKHVTALELAYQKAPNMAIYDMLGPDSASNEYFSAYFNQTADGDTIQNYQGTGDEWFNPVAMAKDGEKTTISNRILTNLGMQYQIIPGRLKFVSNVAYDINNKDTKTFVPQSATGVIDLQKAYNSTTHTDNESYGIQSTSQFIYTQDFNEVHSIIAVAALSLQSTNSISQEGQSERSPSLQITNHTSESPIKKLDSDLNRYREAGYIFNVRYAYKEKYVINPGFRYDGSSQYGLANKWGFRPIISMAYFVSREPFMQNIKWLDDLKFRASYGQIGSNPGNVLESYGLYTGGDQYMYIQGVKPKNIQLYNLRGELIEKYNVGIDLYAFSNRLSATLEYYSDITKDALQEKYKIPASTGYEYLVWYNSGSVKNSGLEFQTNAKIIKRENILFTVDFNIAVNKNKILEVPDNISEDDVNMLENGKYTSRIIEGGSVHAYYGYIYDGVYATDADAIARDSDGNPLLDAQGNPLYMRFDNSGGYVFKGGDARYRDINYDGLINELDIVQLGKPYPDFHGGFGAGLTLFKNLSIRTSFHYKVGHDIVNEAKMNLENMYGKSNQAISVNRRWREQGDVTDIPRALYNYGFNWLGSSRFVEDASFLKLRFITVSYSLPKKVLEKTFVKEWDVFFTMYNLYTWTNYTGQNPEVSVVSTDVKYIGKDNSKTPPPKEISLGLNVKF
ncbi:MAG: SusC/RagA family TonB-linked outer membrane protein [Bacteroidales bacterium]|nr:SusC/RagA family TonB-linked outer membrane protein [Bacteroidales bacterium]